MAELRVIPCAATNHGIRDGLAYMRWAQRKVADIADLCLGKMLDQRKNKGAFRPYLANVNVRWGSFDLSNLREMRFEEREMERYGVRTGDIVMCEGGEPGRCAIWREQVPGMMLQKALHRIRARSDVDHRFLYYTFLDFGRARKLEQFFTGSTIKHLPGEKLAMIKVPVPPLGEQRRIASILSAYDDLIENNTRRITILEEMARRIYEEWFVHFRFPGHENVRLVESELGPVPEGWAIGTVADIADVYRGRSYKSSELADSGGRAFVNLKCIDREGGYRASGVKRYTGAFKDTQVVRDGDLAMAVTDMTQERRIVARIARVSQLHNDIGVISMDLVRIAPHDGVPSAYVYAMLRWSGFADEVKQYANGANVLHLSPDRITEYELAIPSLPLVVQFNHAVAPMLALSDSLEATNTNLRTTRDLLLPKLISGELDVSEMPDPEAAAA